MRHRSIAISLSLLWFLSACSGSNSGVDESSSAISDNTNPESPLPNETGDSNQPDMILEPQNQPIGDDNATASVNDGATNTSAGNISDGVASEEPMPGTSSVLNSDNVDAVILQAFDIYSGRAYDRRMTDFPYIEKVAVQFQEPPYNEFNDTVFYRSLSCNDAGNVIETSSEADQPLLVNSLYTTCTIGADQLNGRVVLSEGNNGGFQRQFSDSFSVNFPGNGIMEVSGNYQYQPSLTFTQELVAADLNYKLSYDGGALSIENANTTRRFRLDGELNETNNISMMEGSFNMTPPVLNGASVSVATTEAFVNEEKPSQLSYARGRLQIIASDSEIIVDALNGDADTVEVSLIGSDGSVSTRTVSWQRWHDALAFEPPGLAEHVERTLPQLGSEATLLTQNSYTTILRSAFNIYNGESIGPAILEMPGYPMPEFPPGIGTPGFPDGFAEPVSETCDNGGSAVLTPYKWGARQITTGWNSEFSNCERNGISYEGVFKTRDFGNFVYRSPEISIVDSSGTKQLNGNLDYKHTTNRDGSPTVNVIFNGSYTDNTQGADSFEVKAANSQQSGLYQYLRSIHGKFHMKNAETGQNWVAVSTPDPLLTLARRNIGNPEFIDYPRTGLMTIDAGNGNSLWLRPDNGDESTFDIYIYTAGAEPIQVTEAWSDWMPYIQFKNDLHNR